jgi:hypothetical protein
MCYLNRLFSFYLTQIGKTNQTEYLNYKDLIVIGSNASQSVSTTFVNSLEVLVQNEIPCVYKAKPSGVLVVSDNQNIHQLLHRLTLEQTITNLR